MGIMPDSWIKKMVKDENMIDPFVEKLSFIHGINFICESVDLHPETISSKDLIIMATDHDEFDIDMIQKNAMKIIDTRGVYNGSFPNVVKA